MSTVLNKCTQEQLAAALEVKLKNSRTEQHIRAVLIEVLSSFGLTVQQPDVADDHPFPDTPLKTETSSVAENKRAWLPSCIGISVNFKLIPASQISIDNPLINLFVKSVHETSRKMVFDGVIVKAQVGDIIPAPQGCIYRSFCVQMFPSKHFPMIREKMSDREISRLSLLRTAEDFWSEMMKFLSLDESLRKKLVMLRIMKVSAASVVDLFMDKTISVGHFVGPETVLGKTKMERAVRMSQRQAEDSVSAAAIGKALTKPLFRPESSKPISEEQVIESLIVPAPGKRIAGLTFESPEQCRVMLRIFQRNFPDRDFMQHLLTLRISLPDEKLYCNLTEEATKYKVSRAAMDVISRHRFKNCSSVDHEVLVLCFAQFKSYLTVLHDRAFQDAYSTFKVLSIEGAEPASVEMVADPGLFTQRLVKVLTLTVKQTKDESSSDRAGVSKQEFYELCLFEFLPMFKDMCMTGNPGRLDADAVRKSFKSYMKFSTDPYVRSFATSSLVFEFVCKVAADTPDELLGMLKKYPAPAEEPRAVAVARELVSAFLTGGSLGQDNVWLPPAPLRRRLGAILEETKKPGKGNKRKAASLDYSD